MLNTHHQDIALREFHISRKARDRYQFDETLFALSGNVVFANFYAARTFAQKINDKLDLVNFPERAVRAGQINAMGLIDEIMHYVIKLYRQQRKPTAMREALACLEEELSTEAVDKALLAFVDEFPPVAVYKGKITPEAYLESETEGTPHRLVALEEMLLLWIANVNPAMTSFLDLFDDSQLEKATAYKRMMDTLHTFFKQQPPFGPDNQNLIDMLRTPAIEVPHSLQGQLDYISTRWSGFLGKYLYRLLSSLDFLAEEDKMFFGFGPGEVRPYEFEELEVEAENFSPDSDWMPRLVLLAKNAYVWLDQLSQKYQRLFTKLNEVPDEELDLLAQWGFTGIWLIGLWQRSTASKRIKQIMGNPEAVASAYSLEEYRIADDLGGEEAFNDLKVRAWQRGIRMASDMVPNHVGIDSKWVIEKPDWFISLDYSPFPSYTFTGEDLCEDPRVGIYLEDHYYTRSDAAVVFKRTDHWTGNTKYIYHGNDGTSMPWNDTAQLNYLKHEVREAVIQTILQVAQRSPIIRFDAAMTLAKKHYHRLWFPEPGTGGDIPSRAEFGMTQEEFNAAMPNEFWREVVDRVAQEAPDTLLLAEAFWLMEGYFVRTLGMHRVYNSAFMNMMRDEKNSEYRQLIKNTLEFDPQILKRYVNFMNNPDERTAVDQFGKGDKYFGICAVMSTMPGLPMFGHGQLEGYAEKYGMEFRRAYWDEKPDPYLVERHERQIFPLLHKRYLFAEVADFHLYDFFTSKGYVDENVFAYSNKRGHQRSLVLYHNKYAETQGWVGKSVAYAVKDANGEKKLVQKTLAEGLNIPDTPNTFIIFRDASSSLEYIRSCQKIHTQGLYAQLHAYQIHVFVDFREIQDNEWQQYAQLNDYLDGRGVPDIEEAMKELFLAPVHTPFRMLVSAPAFRWLMDARIQEPGEAVDTHTLEQVEHKMLDLLRAVKHVTQSDNGEEAIALEVRSKLEAALSLPISSMVFKPDESDEYKAAISYVLENLDQDGPETWGTLFAWLFTHALGKIVNEENFAEISRSWIDEWLLGKLIANTLQDMGLEENEASRCVARIKLLLNHRRWLKAKTEQQATAYELLQAALREHEVQAYLGINRYQGVLWFNKEAFEEILWWLMLLETVERIAEASNTTAEEILATYTLIQELVEAEEASEYQVGKLLEAAKS